MTLQHGNGVLGIYWLFQVRMNRQSDDNVKCWVLLDWTLSCKGKQTVVREVFNWVFLVYHLSGTGGQTIRWQCKVIGIFGYVCIRYKRTDNPRTSLYQIHMVRQLEDNVKDLGWLVKLISCMHGQTVRGDCLVLNSSLSDTNEHTVLSNYG